jgi:hypothetical protein
MEEAGSLAQISAVELALSLILIALSVLGGVAGYLWTRWMTRQEGRIDVVEQRQWDMLERVSTKDDIRDSQKHLDGRLDRLENRMDYAAGLRSAE